MNLSERIWGMATAALLALTVVLLWSPEDQGSVSRHDHGAQSLPQNHFTHVSQNGHHRVPNANLDSDCNASSFGCCMMTLCHPAISVEAHAMPFVGADDATTIAAALLGLGSDPEVILPPPRPVFV